jgi:hypothetical protein
VSHAGRAPGIKEQTNFTFNVPGFTNKKFKAHAFMPKCRVQVFRNVYHWGEGGGGRKGEGGEGQGEREVERGRVINTVEGRPQ